MGWDPASLPFIWSAEELLRAKKEGISKKKKQRLTVTTKKGRVVYDRKRHFFAPADARRAWRAAYRPDTYSLGGQLAATYKFTLFCLSFMLQEHKVKEFWEDPRWIYDYFKGFLGGVQELLREYGLALAHQIDLTMDGEVPGSPGTPT